MTYYFQKLPIDVRVNNQITGSKLQLQITRKIRTGNLLHMCLMFCYYILDTRQWMLLLKLDFQIENKRTHLIKIIQDFNYDFRYDNVTQSARWIISEYDTLTYRQMNIQRIGTLKIKPISINKLKVLFINSVWFDLKWAILIK